MPQIRGCKGALRSKRPTASVPLVASCLIVAFAAGRAESAAAPEPISTPASAVSSETTADYVIGPLDKLDVTVFQVKDLSMQGLQVDASGQITMPLIGNVTAAGKTSRQLSLEIAGLLGAKYLQSPQVSVVVSDSSRQKVTVEGEVKTPGVYKMPGRTTLMEAIAMGGGLTDTANTRKVAIIRTVDGQRRSILCNYNDVRSGRIADPMLQAADVIIVDGSRAKGAWQTFLRSAPIIAILAAAA